MKMRRLGRTGLQVSEVGFGGAPAGIENYTGQWDPNAQDSAQKFNQAVARALDLGINFFDTAMAYGAGRSEQMLGAALGNRRQQVILATKTNWRQQTRAGIEANLNASLDRLGTDYIDLYQIHGDHPDLYTPEDLNSIVHGEVLDAIERARDAGKVRFIGLTSEDPTAAMPFMETGRFDTVQVRYNLVYQSAFHHLLPQCERLDIGVLTMRTNTSGILQKYLEATGWKEQPGGYNVHEAALNYVLSDTRVSGAIVGMRSVRSVESTVAIAANTSKRVDLEWLHARRADAQRAPWVLPAASAKVAP